MGKVLCVYLPRWPIRLAMRECQRASVDSSKRDSDRFGPTGRFEPTGRFGESAFAFLLVVSERGSHWVACACERAEAKGVRVGMSLAHAKALLKGTRVWERPYTPAEDARRLHRLARWAQRFSPVVAADEPDGLLLDLAGCERLFGGDQQVVALVDTSFARWGLPVRLALAPTIGCAWAAARFAVDRIRIVAPESIREELASLPIAGLRIDPTFVGALNEVGIERIGSLFDLPREELACRFGADLLRRLDQATGQAVETIAPVCSPMPLEATCIFDPGAPGVTSLEAIVITVRELLFTLVLQLEQRECGVRTLNVVLQRIAAEPLCVSIALTHPSRDVGHLWTLLRSKIERANLGYGVESVSLHASRLGKLFPRQLCFDHAEYENGNQRDETILGESLDRLMDRFGPQGVRGMVVVETHVPEEAFPLRAWSDVRPSVSRHGKENECRDTRGIHRPAQLFEVPEPVQVISLVPEGPPSWIRWRGRESNVRCACGPERIALPWWESKRGTPAAARPVSLAANLLAQPSPDVIRDYYEVQDEQGRLLWVFRDHVTHGWFVHGLWA